MKQDKKTPKAEQPKSLRLRAVKEDGLLPIFYEGKIVKIRREGMELEVAKIPHESKIHIDQALKNGEIEQFKGEDK